MKCWECNKRITSKEVKECICKKCYKKINSTKKQPLLLFIAVVLISILSIINETLVVSVICIILGVIIGFLWREKK